MVSLSPLNPTQEKASRTLEGPVLVVAGAGTGKTRTLIYRLVRLIESGIHPKSILLLTFTRRSAQEMISRASEILGGEYHMVAGGTFHSFSHSMLRRYGQLGGFENDFTVLDQADSLEIIGNLRKDMELKDLIQKFPKRQTLAAMISKMVNKQVSLKLILETEYSHFEDQFSTINKLVQAYDHYKMEHHFMDFDDLLVKFVQLLQNNSEVKTRICKRYPFVMVDEYQDTNLLQSKITEFLAGSKQNIMVVGDDAQSIYAFRGANIENLFNFNRKFKNTCIVKLEENYRSTQSILDVANALLNQMSQSFRKRLFTQITGSQKPFLVMASDEMDQAKYVARKIESLVQEGIKISEIAVLFRASHHAYLLEIELGKLSLPYVKYGGFKFTETAHVKDALAYLRVLDNPSEELSLTRILMLCDGVGRVTARKIRQLGKGKGILEMLKNYQAKGKIKAGLGRLEALFKKLSCESLSPKEAFECIIEYYTPIMELNYDDWPKRNRDLKQLISISHNYKCVSEMLSDMTLDPPNISKKGNLDFDEEDSDLVLSTVHSAKGLEWKAVFVLQVVDGAFPMIRSFAESQEDQKELDEELRLLYVAVTRAKEKLYLVCPKYSGKGYNFGASPVSQFIKPLSSSMFQKEQASPRSRSRRFLSY